MPTANEKRVKAATPTQAPVRPCQELLSEAHSIVSVDRNAAYGNPENNFQNIADRWNLYLQQRGITNPFNGGEITPQDVAHMMIDMKMARLGSNMLHRDSLVDIAGYAACAEDCRVASAG